MSLTIEQNWKWLNKTFPHTLCVVSISDETTQCRICLTSNKNLHWASGGEVCGYWLTYAIYYPNIAWQENLIQRFPAK